MSDDKGRTKWVDNVLVVWVEHEAINYFALEADDSLKFKILFGNLFHFSFKILFNLVEIVSNLSDCNGGLNVKGMLTVWYELVYLIKCITVNILAVLARC